MYCKLALAALAVIIGSDFATAKHIPSTTTAGELWNPWTWFWPYAIASAESYRDYFQKSQAATNELYQQIYKTNAFPWITGNWNPQNNNNNQGQNDDKNTNNGTGGQTPTQDNENSEKPAEEEKTPQEGETNQEDKTPQEGETNQDNQTPQEGETNQENQTPEEGTEAQVQGNVQDDGTAEAEVNKN